jgi:hypothetical protein
VSVAIALHSPDRGAAPNQGLELTASSVRCAAVVHATFPSQMGRMQRRAEGQRLTWPRKGEGTRACRPSRAQREDADTVARRDPRDPAKARRPAVQGPAVPGGPLATASKRQRDASPRPADGRSDLCESSPAPGGRGRHEWTASLTLRRVVCVNCGMAYGVRALGSQSGRSSRRLGKPATGRRATGGVR